MIEGCKNHKNKKEEKGNGCKWNPKDLEKDNIAKCLRANAALCPTDNTIIEWVADYRYDEGLRIRKNNIIPCLNSSMSINESLSASGTLIKQNKIRRLTPIECERLQGFPDGWTEGLSDTQRYKCLGNAVTTNVVSEVIRSIYL